MLSHEIVIYLLLSHFIADFIFINDAKNNDFGWLTVHSVFYTSIFFLCLFAGNLFFDFRFITLLAYALLNGTLHFVCDFIFGKLSTQYKDKKENHNFFICYATSQFFHLAIIIYTFQLINPLEQ